MITWDVDKIINDLRACSAQMNSPYNEGYSQWGCKKDLLTIKYELDRILNNATTFSYLEEEWLEEQSKKETWEVLKTQN